MVIKLFLLVIVNSTFTLLVCMNNEDARARVKYHLEKKLNINGFLSNTNTYPLMLMARDERNRDIVKELLENGADPNSCTENDGKSIFHICATNGNVEILELLFEHMRMHDEKWQELLTRIDVGSHTILDSAISAKKLNCVKLLVSYGAKINSNRLITSHPLVILFNTREDNAPGAPKRKESYAYEIEHKIAMLLLYHTIIETPLPRIFPACVARLKISGVLKAMISINQLKILTKRKRNFFNKLPKDLMHMLFEIFAQTEIPRIKFNSTDPSGPVLLKK